MSTTMLFIFYGYDVVLKFFYCCVIDY